MIIVFLAEIIKTDLFLTIFYYIMQINGGMHETLQCACYFLIVMSQFFIFSNAVEQSSPENNYCYYGVLVILINQAHL